MRGWSLLGLWIALQVLGTGGNAADEEDEDDALIVYDEEAAGAGGGAQCTAPPGPVMVKELVEEIGHDVSEEVIERTVSALAAEGVVQTRQLLQLFPQDYDALVIPLLLKSRLRRIRERGGKIPEDMIGHKKPAEGEEEAGEGAEGTDDASSGEEGVVNEDDIL
eukprot:gb/GFBE01076877.1/.p1 GENE.gb/GFBE01076877.1/~~gb/GFBE01076877.1/.p1  ORF type:complete len:164 (+),score=52.46 gb/GFBE01076877.1/:1-492(+)